MRRRKTRPRPSINTTITTTATYGTYDLILTTEAATTVCLSVGIVRIVEKSVIRFTGASPALLARYYNRATVVGN